MEALEQRRLLSADFGYVLPGTRSFSEGDAVAADSAGNVYMIGENDTVAKYDSAGNLKWFTTYTTTLDGDAQRQIAVSPSGDVYISGSFYKSATFGTTTLGDGSALYSAFVAKLNSFGVFQWARNWSGSGFGTDAFGLAVDSAGSAYLAGSFWSTVNPGGGPTLTSAGIADALLAKYDSSGNFLWAKQIGGDLTDEVRSVAVDAAGNVYATGQYAETVDIDPGPGVITRNGAINGSEFLWKLDSSGNLLWADASEDTNFGLGGSSKGMSLAVDSFGNVYTAGVFTNTADLDPTHAGVDILQANSVSDNDVFVQKVDSAGRFLWVRQMRNSTFGVTASDIAVDAAGNAYIVGSFQGSADFNWGKSPIVVSSAGWTDGYLWQLDPQGNTTWATAFGSTDEDGVKGIAVNNANELFLTGFFSDTVDFDPNLSTHTATTFFDTSFILKLTQSSISGRVFNDRNSDGLRSAYEPGLSGVAVSLYQTIDGTVGNSDDTLVATTVTNSSGQYRFIGVGSGNNYYIKVRTPEGFSSYTTRHVGANRSIDSDVDASGATEAIPIVPQENDVEDAGLIGSVPTFGFAMAATTPANTQAKAVAIDLAGNVYYGGVLNGTADFDLGAGTYNVTGANAAFIAKYTPGGALLWAQAIPMNNNQAFSGLKVDANGNVFVLGMFSGAIDFDPGPAAYTITGDFAQNPYVLKLDGQGKFVWARELVSGLSVAGGLAIDESSNVYTTGSFSGTANFNPGGVSVQNLTSTGGDDVFLSKLDSNGNFVWVKDFGGASNDAGKAVAVDGSGNVVITGSFTGSATFTQLFTPHTLTGSAAPNATAFLLELDPDGNYLWSNALVATTSSAGVAIATDDLGNVYAAGAFNGTSTFGGSVGLSGSAYIIKLDNLGNFTWADAWDATLGFEVHGLSVDSSGNVYGTGLFSGTTDFDPSVAGTSGAISINSSADVYVLKLASDGSFSSVSVAGGDAPDQGNAVALGAGGSIYAAGLLGGAGNFNPFGTPPFNIGQTGSTSAFLWKISPNVNVAPSFTPGGDQTVSEDSGAISVPNWASNISAGPTSENGQSLQFLVTNDNAALFAVPPAIDPGTGKLTYTLAPFTIGTAHVNVTLQDSGGTANGGIDSSAVQSFTITVVPINHAPSFTGGPNQIVNEDTGAHSVNGWASNISPGAGPDDVGQTLNFVVTNDNNSLFIVQPSLDASTGALSYTLAANAYGTANVTVWLHDNGGTLGGGVDTSAPLNFVITVNGVNDAPSFIGGASQTVNEDAGAVSVPGWAANINPGPNEAGQALTFVIVSNDKPSLFSVQPAVNPITGALTYTVAPNMDGVAHLKVLLQDDGGTANGGADSSAAQNFTITVNFVNEAPSFTAGGNVSVVQNTGLVAIANWATNISPGVGANEALQSLNFNVSNDNNALFAAQPTIDPFTGTLLFTPAPNAFGVANVQVSLQDSGGTANGGVDTSATQTFKITVVPINAAPNFTAGPNVTNQEDDGAETVVGWATNISTGDPPQISQTLDFIVSNDNNGLFSVQPAINPSTGTLTYVLAPDANGAANVTVQLHDSGGTSNGGVDASAPQTFTITVSPVNDAPSFAKGADQLTFEGTGTHAVFNWASAISAGPPDEAGQALNFTVTNDNNSLFLVSPAVSSSGTLTYTLAPYASGVAHVTVRLHDDGGTANGGVDTSALQTFVITAQFVNQAPSFVAGPDQVVLEDSGPALVPGWAANISPGLGNGDAGQTLTFDVTNDNNSLFAVQPSIDPLTGDLTYTPAPNASGSATVYVQLTDDGGTANSGANASAIQTFSISVAFVNKAPAFTAGGDQTVNENTGSHVVSNWATNITSGPGDVEAGQSLDFMVSNDNSALFAIEPAVDPFTGALSYVLAPNASGVAHVTVQLHDDGGTDNGGSDTSAPQTFTINVNLVNSAPSFSRGTDQSVNENAGPQTVVAWATNISPGAGAAEALQSLNFQVSNDNSSLFAVQPSISAAGMLTYTPALNASGVAHVTVRLHDDGGTANGGVDTSAAQTFTITVNFVNNAPSFTAGPDQTANQDSGTHIVSGWAYNISPGPGLNEANQTLNFVVSNDNTSLFVIQPAISAGGTLTYTLNPGVTGTANVSVELHDSGGTANGGVDESATATFAINVVHVNHAPTVVAPLADQTFNEDAGDAVIPLAGVFDDADIATFADSIAYSIGSNDNAALVNASISGGNLILHLTPNQSGVAHLAVRATDLAMAAVDDLLTVRVNSVNDPPSFTAGPSQLANVNAGLVTVPNWATNINPGPNEAGQLISFDVTNDNHSLFLVQPAVSADGVLTYTLYPGSFGSAHVTVIAHDNGGTANGGIDSSAPQTFLLQVKSPPTATNDSYVLSAATVNATNPAQGVIANDVNPYGDALTARLLIKPTHGTVTFNADGTFTYTKGAGFQGLDKFTYKLINGTAASNPGTVVVVSYEAATVRKLYEQVLHRDPDDAGLQYWTNRIQNGDPYSVVAQGIFESNERLDPIIRQYYQQFFLRTADAQGVAYWRDQVWKRDGGPDNVIAGMISSPEFFQSAGGTNIGWVAALYNRLLNRSADAQGLQYWTNVLNQNVMTRQQVVLGFLHSAENFANEVRGFFQTYLQRAPSDAELANYVQQMQAGASERDVQIALIASDEYRNTPTPPPSGSMVKLS